MRRMILVLVSATDMELPLQRWMGTRFFAIPEGWSHLHLPSPSISMARLPHLLQLTPCRATGLCLSPNTLYDCSASREGKTLLENPTLADPLEVKNAPDYTGTFTN